MLKSAYILIISILFFDAAYAQHDTSIYYLKKSWKRVSTSDSADYKLLIAPPDPMGDKNLFIVKELYSNGRVRFISGSLINKLESVYPKFPGYFKPVLHGKYVSFYPNGYKMLEGNYEKGNQIGDQVTYYPNGKLYTSKTYTKEKKWMCIECRDSTGTVLVKNGNGNWLTFDENFKGYVEGQVINGLEEGNWRGKRNDSVNVIYEYKNGTLLSTADIYKSGDLVYTMLKVIPEFPGGINGLSKFLSENIHYPLAAREGGIQGRVIITFIIEKDGTLADVMVAKGIGGGCDEEAARVIRLSPPWKPGIQDGKPVRVAYTVPISFTLNRK